MSRIVTCIGRYRIYRGHKYWCVASARSGVLISRHSNRELAEAAARRYEDGDQRRARYRDQLIEGITGKLA